MCVGGDAVAMIVCGQCEASEDRQLQKSAETLHTFRYNPRRPDLNAVWTTQHQTYKNSFAGVRSTNFLIGLLDAAWEASMEKTDEQYVRVLLLFVITNTSYGVSCT